MDNSLVIRSRPGIAPRNNALRDPVAVREANDTELDISKTVNPAGSGGNGQSNNQHHEPPPREPAIDAKSQAALLNAADVRSEHAEPLPEQALMRQRAYGHQTAREIPRESPDESVSRSDPHADIEA